MSDAESPSKYVPSIVDGWLKLTAERDELSRKAGVVCAGMTPTSGIAACRAARAFENCPQWDMGDLCPEAIERKRVSTGRRNHREHLVRLGLPDELLSQVLAGERGREDIQQAVTEFLSGRETLTLIISGDVGVGKTSAGAWAAEQVIGSRWLKGAQFERIHRFGEESTWRELETTAPLVVLDELGGENLADDDITKRTRRREMASRVLQVVDCRHDAGKKTLITTNMVREKFLEDYGGVRLHDRMKERGRWQTFAGESLRQRKG